MKLSIIVPVYNVAPYLRACLDSLVAAAKRLEVKSKNEKGKSAGVEIICIDDGSTDGSSQILDHYHSELHKPSNIQVLHQQNAGVSAARNAALDVATGDWIGFVDADDTVSERWLEVAVGLIEEKPDAEIVKLTPLVSVKDEHGPTGCSKYEKWWLPRSVAAERARTAEVKNITVREGAVAREVGLRDYSRYGWSMPNFVRRDFIGSVRFPVGMRLKEDICFFVQLANRLTCWVEAEFPGYFYTRRDGSAVMRHRSDEDSLKFVREMLKVEGVVRAVSTAIGYEFVQWAEERDPNLPYDARSCPIRAAWRKAWEDGLIDLGDLPFFWRPAIWWWVCTGQLWFAKLTRRTREWMARFI